MTSAEKIRNLLSIAQEAQSIINQANALLWLELTQKPKRKARTRAKRSKTV